jgi:hypothetical protein
MAMYESLKMVSINQSAKSGETKTSSSPSDLPHINKEFSQRLDQVLLLASPTIQSLPALRRQHQSVRAPQ